MINGVACHESGCPNKHARWDMDGVMWVRQIVCDTCGYDCDVGTECCTEERIEDDVEPDTAGEMFDDKLDMFRREY